MHAPLTFQLLKPLAQPHNLYQKSITGYFKLASKKGLFLPFNWCLVEGVDAQISGRVGKRICQQLKGKFAFMHVVSSVSFLSFMLLFKCTSIM